MSEPTCIEQIHATAVLIDGKGVVLRGPSGSGKSDLALRLIDEDAMLIADDRVDLNINDGQLHCAPPENLAGMIEVRGVGIVKLDFAPTALVHLVVDLVSLDDEPRLPDAQTNEFFGQSLRYLKLFAFAPSTPAKIRLALTVGPEAMVEPS